MHWLTNYKHMMEKAFKKSMKKEVFIIIETNIK